MTGAFRQSLHRGSGSDRKEGGPLTPGTSLSRSSGIGSLNEKPLHAALKTWYSLPEDRQEVPVDGYLIDIVRRDLLIEIQTRNFAAIKRKLLELTARHAVRLAYPIAQERWIVKAASHRQEHPCRRKSPKRGAYEEVFAELVHFPRLLASPNFSLDVVLIHEEEVRCFDTTRGWRRRGWVTHERRLLRVVDRKLIRCPVDMLELVPSGLPRPFTTSDLAVAIRQRRWLAQKMAYCLREMGLISHVGKRGNAWLYEMTD